MARSKNESLKRARRVVRGAAGSARVGACDDVLAQDEVVQPGRELDQPVAALRVVREPDHDVFAAVASTSALSRVGVAPLPDLR